MIKLLALIIFVGLSPAACVSYYPTTDVLNEPVMATVVPTTAPPLPIRSSPIVSQLPTPLPTSTSSEKCYRPFQEIATLHENAANASPEVWQDVTEQIVNATVKAGEDYLNSCTEPNKPLAAQAQALEELKRFAEVIPSTRECAFRYVPTLQLMDFNGDGVDELVLHTQAANCDGYAPGFGGMSAVYYLSQSQWHGRLIWPCFDVECSTNGFSSQVPEPKIKKLTLRDSKDRAFMLVDGYFIGADALREIVSIWRWDVNGPKQVLNVDLSNWCGTPIKWTLTQEDYIFVPATKQTDRCAAQRATTYILRNDEFVAVKQ